MAAIFGPAANLVSKVVLARRGGDAHRGIPRLVAMAANRLCTSRAQCSGAARSLQPSTPCRGLGLDCRFCHTSVETSANAGLPPTTTCMTCHSQIWTNAALLAPVRASLANDTPIVWHRVTDLPGYVYFNHSIHIAKGVGCESCHGAVDDDGAHLQSQIAHHGVLLGLPSQSGPQSTAEIRAL